jgi:hypothetical protein
MEKKITVKQLADNDDANKRIITKLDKMQPFVNIPVYHSADLLWELLKSPGLKTWSGVFTADGCRAKVEYRGKVYTISVNTLTKLKKWPNMKLSI